MIKVKVIRNMIDKETLKTYRAGDKISIHDKRRYNELLKAGVIEKVKDLKEFNNEADK